MEDMSSSKVVKASSAMAGQYIFHLEKAKNYRVGSLTCQRPHLFSLVEYTYAAESPKGSLELLQWPLEPRRLAAQEVSS